jgi:hypothetical protein
MVSLSCSDTIKYEKYIPAMSVITVVLILMLDKNTYTNDLRLTFSCLKSCHKKNFWICFLTIMLVFVLLSSSEIISCKECGLHFDTIEALREHEKSEQDDKELQNKGL